MPKKMFFAMETLPPGEAAYAEYFRKKREEYRIKAPGLSREELELLVHRERMAMASKGEYGDLLALCVLWEVEEDGGFSNFRVPVTKYDSKTGVNIFKTLERFWEWVKDLDPNADRLVGYKIRKEALPFLCKQTAMFDEPGPPHGLCFTGARAEFVFDVWEAWNHGFDEDVSLSDLADFLSLVNPETKELLDKTEADKAECAGRYDEIMSRCWMKVELIRSIYYRLNFEAEPPLGQ